MNNGAFTRDPECPGPGPDAASGPAVRTARAHGSRRLTFLFLALSVTHPGLAGDWTNSLGGRWSDPLNWSDHLTPTGVDAVVALPGSYVVTLDTDAAVRGFRFDNPTATVGGTGLLAVSDVFVWRSGTLGGPASAVLSANGGMLLSGSAAGTRRSLGRTLINAGLATWDDPATLALSNGGVISNTASGTFVLAGQGIVDAAGGSGGFHNAGTLRKTGSGTTDFSAELRNTGTVRIESGTLNLRQGTLHSGSLQISNLAGLALLAGTHTFVAGSTLTGAGGLTIAGGNTTIGGLVDLSGPQLFRGGNVAVTGTFQAISNTVTVDGANLTFSGNLRCIGTRIEVVSGSARFDGSGTLEPQVLVVGPSGRLEGSTPVVVRGPLTLQSATLAGRGTLVARDGLTLGGGGLNLTGRILVNAGTARWGGAPAGPLTLASGALITNLAGATFDLDLDATVADTGGAGGFVNEGLFRKTGGAGRTVVTTPFANHGTLDALAGTLALLGGGNHRGSYVIGPAARIELGGTHTFDPDSSLAGPGVFAVVSGTANIGGRVEVSGDHVFAGGTANLTGRYVAITNLVAITGGTANFSGSGQVAPSSLIISNQGVLGGSGLVTVRGPLRWSAGRMQGSGLVVAEGGLE
ncbi:MAG: hypothetical protein JNL97_01325, partial [Verrucomicrobiales bacterium]|nr:hypothetical protein [Verrucomicrobiales bacterium]